MILDNVFIGFGLDVGEVRLSKFCLAQFGDCECREISVEVKWIKDCLKFWEENNVLLMVSTWKEKGGKSRGKRGNLRYEKAQKGSWMSIKYVEDFKCKKTLKKT